MKSLIRKVKKVLNAINLQNMKSVLRYIKNNGFKGLGTTIINKIRFGKVVLDEYATWIANNEPNTAELENEKKYESCQNLKFDIICPNDEKLIKSIENQTYKKYNVYEFEKERILNSKSDYLIFLGNNIELAQFALYEIVKSIEYRDSILIYSDNDKLIDEKRTEPHFKPGFARDTILSQNYIGQFIAVKTDFIKIHQDILNNLNKNIIYDILLQISEKTRKIEHIQKILYHETIENRKIDVEDEKQIIAKHLKRMNLEYDNIKDGRFEGQYKINYKIKGNPLVSLVVPNMDHIQDLSKLLKSLEKSTYSNYEVIIVENNSKNKETFEYYEKISKQDNRIKVCKFDINYFNYSAIVNYGVECSNGEYIVMLNNDIEFITEDWIEQLLMYAQRPDVGICGAKLYFPDRSIQHAGVTLGTRGLAGHRCREVHEKDFKNNTKDNHYDRPGKQFGCLQIGFRCIHFPSDGGLRGTDNLCHDTGFPAHAKRQLASGHDKGHKCRTVDINELFPGCQVEYLRHLQKLHVYIFQSLKGIGVDDRQNDQERQVNGKCLVSYPD